MPPVTPSATDTSTSNNLAAPSDVEVEAKTSDTTSNVLDKQTSVTEP